MRLSYGGDSNVFMTLMLGFAASAAAKIPFMRVKFPRTQVLVVASVKSLRRSVGDRAGR